MSDVLNETGAPDPLAPPAPVDPPAVPAAPTKPKAKAPAKRKPAAKKAPAKPKAVKTGKVKFVGTSPTVCDHLGQHGYPTLAQVGKIYELPLALAEGLVRSLKHFVSVK